MPQSVALWQKKRIQWTSARESQTETEPPEQETAQEKPSRSGVLPTTDDIQQAADHFADESNVRLTSIPETIPCAVAGEDGIVGYTVSTDGSEPATAPAVLLLEYRQGVWKRMDGRFPCVPCHPDTPITLVE